MRLVVVQVVVIADIERRARTWCPAGEKLRAQPRAKSVVVNYGPRESGTSELIRPSESKDVDVKRCKPGVPSFQHALDEIERHAQFVGWLVGYAAGRWGRVWGEMQTRRRAPCCSTSNCLAPAVAHSTYRNTQKF